MKNLFVFATALVMLASCSTERSTTTGYNYDVPGRGGFGNQSESLYSGETKPDFKTRMVVYNASLDLAVKKTDSVNSYLTAIASRYGGYALNLGTSYSTIRVKADQLPFALREVSALGKVRSKNVSGNDVTDEYKDLEIRLDNAKRARDKYLSLLEKAENVDAALKVEKELERLNGEIDLLEGKQKRLSHLNEFSTISVRYSEKVKPGLLGYIGMGLWKGVKWLFVRN